MSRTGRIGRATPKRALPIVAVLVVPVLAAVVIAQSVAGIPVRDFLSDTRSIADLPLYAGLVSYLGVVGWTAAAAVLLFAGLLLRADRTVESTFLVRAGLLTGWLGLDDLFELHERAFAGVGVPELLTYSAYAIAALAHLVLSWPVIRKTQWWLLAVAVVAFGLSIGTDVAVHDVSEDAVLRVVDEGAKFFGIVAWGAYHVDCARSLLRGHLASPDAAD